MRPEKQLKTFKIKLFVKRKSDSVIEEGAWNEYYNSSLNHYDICLRITFVLSFYVVVIQKKKCRPRLVRNSFFVHFIGSVQRTRWSLQQNRRSVQLIPGGVQPTGKSIQPTPGSVQQTGESPTKQNLQPNKKTQPKSHLGWVSPNIQYKNPSNNPSHF